MPGLDGQVALITGAGRGIGAAIARELASAGMRVALTARTETEVEAVAEEVKGLALVGDVSSTPDVERWENTTRERLGPIDLLINNAGVAGAPEPFWEQPAEEWWRVFEINLLGPFLCCRAVLPSMLDRRSGRIVNITSGAAYLPTLPSSTQDTSYPSSKAALTRFTERLAVQLEATGVHAFAVAPGLIRSQMTADLPDDTPWTPPEAPSQLIRAIAEGKADALHGRYLHAEHDADIGQLAARAQEIKSHDLNAIRLRR